MNDKTSEMQVQALIDSIVQTAMREEFEVAMKDFVERISPQWTRTLATVFQSGVTIGATRALAAASVGFIGELPK